MLKLFIRLAVSLVAGIVLGFAVVRVFYLAMTTMETVGAEIMVAVGALMVYGFVALNSDEIDALADMLADMKKGKQ